MIKYRKARKKKDVSEKYSIRIQGGKNGLVEASYKMDIMEFRIFATMLTMVFPEDEDFTEYVISVNDIIKLFRLSKSGQLYEMVRLAADRLLDRKFIIPEISEDGIEYENKINMLASVKTPIRKQHQNHIKVTFHPDLKPYLLRLQKEYLTVDVRNIIDIQSPYSVKLYFVLKHQIKLGNTKIRYSLVRLRQILTIEQDEYPLYGNFKQKILKKAIADIGLYTDIVVNEMTEEKHGRAVYAVVFHLENKNRSRLEITETRPSTVRLHKIMDGIVHDVNIEEILNHEEAYEVRMPPDYEIDLVVTTPEHEIDPVEEIYANVKNYKVTHATVQDWVKLYPVKQIEHAVAHVKQLIASGYNIKNVGGYLNKLVRTPSLFDTYTEQNTAKEATRKKKDTKDGAEREQKALVDKQAQLAEEYLSAKTKLAISLFKANPALAKTIYQYIEQEANSFRPRFMASVAWESLEKVMHADISNVQFIKLLEANEWMTLKFHVLEVLQTQFVADFNKVKVNFQEQADKLGVTLT